MEMTVVPKKSQLLAMKKRGISIQFHDFCFSCQPQFMGVLENPFGF